VNLLLKSRKVHRFFERRFARLEPELARLNSAANVPAERPRVDWEDVPELCDFRRFYSFHDKTCEDVLGMPTEAWWRSHFRGRYRLHLESHETLPYSCEEEDGALRFRSSSAPDTWIYLVSREELPPVYAVEFDYTPFAVFKEQLQFDFAATSLADRHRYILSYNEKIRYQRIERGFWLPDVGSTSFSLPLGVPTRVRLEVVGNVFVLLAGGKRVACWRDRRYAPQRARNFLLFWNGPDERAMDFRISGFTVQFERNPL